MNAEICEHRVETHQNRAIAGRERTIGNGHSARAPHLPNPLEFDAGCNQADIIAGGAHQIRHCFCDATGIPVKQCSIGNVNW
jgi:hypothetical protein